MSTLVLYAIRINGYNTRPGFVLNVTENPRKIPVKVFWSWPGQDDDYLNPTPPVLTEFAKFDRKQAGTGEIIEPWADHCARVKAERKAALDKQNAEAAAAEAKRLADIERVAVVADRIRSADIRTTLAYCARRGDYMTRYQFSANDVLNLIESLVSQ